MADFNVRSDAVNVEQIMEQIRSRIREKRGVDYTEQQIRELAAVKLEKFLDPRGVRSELLQEFRNTEPDPNYAFEDETLFETHRGIIRFIRKLLRPILKLFFNPNPLAHVLHMQAQINDQNTRRHLLYYELIHNLVVETTRLGIEVKNLKMRVESLSSRVDFNERRARALESVVVYKPSPEEIAERPSQRGDRILQQPERETPGDTGASTFTARSDNGEPRPSGQSANGAMQPGPGQRSRRRRRRRGRRGGGPPASVLMAGQGDSGSPASAPGADTHDVSSQDDAPEPHEPSDDSGDDSEQ